VDRADFALVLAFEDAVATFRFGVAVFFFETGAFTFFMGGSLPLVLCTKQSDPHAVWPPALKMPPTARYAKAAEDGSIPSSAIRRTVATGERD
jgi:hypothetical protein